ncbi:TolC family outer membrane protein [Dechloromonas denitrificans]|uniref:TolC family outer membrane protein n=1 Tax=Dechloromonas denitrificans TaxID=281362 RepID=UPI001CFA16AF|nr:TolC family outer membrane protein [Dechloromonas denitrificans]UCV08828.1 TolC family outer membrane protein [Dechloromonas denitrificans]
MTSPKVLSLLICLVFPAIAPAADLPSTLKEVAQQAVLNSPEVTSKWHNYKAAEEEIGVARGGYFPRVDLTAGGGRESLKQPPSNQRNDYSRNGYLLSLNQMLFDGFATRNEVRRLDKARLVRYYELLDASETVALEAARAYLDVLRYRFLVNLAEDNYVQHKATQEQLLRRTQSGVGRRVDLEQAGSRLALAEINLTTETANLHDVSARYQRLVGSLPPGVVIPPGQLGSGVPVTSKAALDALYKNNPALLAAIENTEAAQYDVNARRAAYSPRLDFRARTDNTSNYLGVDGDRNYNVAELVVSWNLFNGGSDRAREKQYVERKNLALDLREKACRDTRQTLLIAYNDVQRLKQQTNYLATQVSLLEKTRDAYRDQFNVGQRTLLDLLDTENELLSARRNAVNADSDLSLSYLRTYAGMGTLLQTLGLQKLDSRDPESGELAQADVSQLCPNEAIAAMVPDRAALNARAMALLDSKPAVVPVPVQLMGPEKRIDPAEQFPGRRLGR